MDSSRSRLDSELLYLISRYLSSGPCERAAEALKEELEEKALLPVRYDWTGCRRQQGLSTLTQQLPHIKPDHLPRLLESFVHLWNNACQPPVPGLTSLCNDGALSLLDVTQDARPIPRPADALLAVHHSRPAAYLERHKTSLSSLLKARQLTGVCSHKHMLEPTTFYSKFRKYRRLMGHLCASYCVLYDRTGTRVFTGADDCLLKIWSAQDGRLLSTLRGHQSEVADIAVDLENRLIASGGCDKVIRVWDLQTRAPIAVLLGHSGVITSLQFCPYPSRAIRYLVSTGADGNVCFWEYNPTTFAFCPAPTKFVERGKPGDQILCSSFSAGGCLLVCGGTDHIVRLYQSHPGPPERLAELDGHTDRVQTVQFAHRGSRFVSGARDGTARIWSHSASGWKCVVLSMHTKLPDSNGRKINKPNVTMVAWDLLDQHIITASNDTLLKVWNPDTGSLLHELQGHEDVVFVLEAHPTDERILMSAGHDGVIALWNLKTGTMIKRFENRYEGNGVASVFDCKFSPDGLSMTCCDSQGQVSFFGVQETSAFDKVPDQQFFHTDYHSVIRDVNNHVLDEQTDLPPHAMPPPLLVNMDCNPYAPEVQLLVTGYVPLVVKVEKKESCQDDDVYRGLNHRWPAVAARRRKLTMEKTAREQRWKRARERFLAAMVPDGDEFVGDSDDSDGSFFDFGDLAQGAARRKRSMSLMSGDLDAVLGSPPPALPRLAEGTSSATSIINATAAQPSSASSAGAATPQSAATPMLAPRSGGMLGSFVLPLQAAPVVDGLRHAAATPLRAYRPLSITSSSINASTPAASLPALANADMSAEQADGHQAAAAGRTPSGSAATACSVAAESKASVAMATTAGSIVPPVASDATCTGVASTLVGALGKNSPVRDFPASSATLSDGNPQRPDGAVDYASTNNNGDAERSSESSAADTVVTTVAASSASAAGPAGAAGATGPAGPAGAATTAAAAGGTGDNVEGAMDTSANGAPHHPIAATVDTQGNGAVIVSATVDTQGNGAVIVDAADTLPLAPPVPEEVDAEYVDEEEEAETDAQRATSMAERYVRQQHAANNAVLLHTAATSCPSVDVLLDHWRKRPAAPRLQAQTLEEEELRRIALGSEELEGLDCLKQSSFIPFAGNYTSLASLCKNNSSRTQRATQRSQRGGGAASHASGGRSLVAPHIDVVQASPQQPTPRRRARAPGYRLSSRSDSNRSLPRNHGDNDDDGTASVSDNDGDSSVRMSMEEMSGESSSSAEESDCSDWSEDAGIAKANRAAARRRAAESERLAHVASSHNGAASSRRTKKKPAPKKEPVQRVLDPVELERFWPSAWLTSTEPLPQPYFPQQGDKVLYCRQGHEAYINSITENNVYRIDKKMLPWTKKKFPIRAHEACHVLNVHFVVGPPTLCHLKLRVISSCPDRPDRATFSIQYHDYDNVPDFIVLYSRVKEALDCHWKAGDHFQSMIDGQYWTGAILERTPYDAEQIDSLWQCYDVRWDGGGETELLSPWDMERIGGIQPEGGSSTTSSVLSGNRLVIRTRRQSAAVANEMALGNVQAVIDAQNWLLPGEEELEDCWASEDVDTAQSRVAAGLEKVQGELEIAHPFAYSVDYKVDYPEYCVCVALPTCIDMILTKLRNGFYRRSAALMWEVRLLEKNANAFNEEDSEIVRSSKALVSLLCKFIKLPLCQDPVALYHSGAMLSGDEEDDVDGGADTLASAAALQASGSASVAALSAAMSTDAASSRTSSRFLAAAAASSSCRAGDAACSRASSRSSSDSIRRNGGKHNGIAANGSVSPSSSDSDDEGGNATMRVTRGTKREHPADDSLTDDIPNRPFTAKLRPAALRLIEDVAALDERGLFTEPVDLMLYTDYMSFVKQPMDFKTLRAGVKSGLYPTVADFCQTFLSIFTNSRQYNSQKSSEVYRLTSRVWRKYADSIVPFLVECNNGIDLPQIGVTSRPQKRTVRQSKQHANQALKRRRQSMSSSASSSPSSSGDPSDGDSNSSSDDSGDEDAASGRDSDAADNSCRDSDSDSDSNEEKDSDEDEDEEEAEAPKRGKPRRKPTNARAQNSRAARRTPAKPARAKKGAAQPAAKRRRKVQATIESDESSDNEPGRFASSRVSSMDSAGDVVTGTSRSGRPIRKSTRLQ